MSIDLQKTQYVSSLSGFKNKFGYEVTSVLPGYSIGVGRFISVDTVLTFVNPGVVIGDISSVQIKYDGLETFWRTLDGFVFTEFPHPNLPDYEIGAVTFFTPTQHHVYLYIVNQTGGTINVPSFTLRYRLNTFDAPFSEV